VNFPTRDNIVKLNRRHTQREGSFYVEPDNLRNADSLEWVLEAIQYPLFGVDNYPTLAEKAALLAWVIIDGHVFHDGCKRTGMSALDIFIRQNDHWLDASDEEIVEVALKVAGENTESDYTFNEFAEWVRSRLIPIGLLGPQYLAAYFSPSMSTLT
jgi:death-on-curing protein